MNNRRMVVLLLAAVAAGGAALLMRGMLGGGAEKASAHIATPPLAMVDVLVADRDITPGEPVGTAMVHWQAWPKTSVSSDLITNPSGNASVDAILAGAVARSPIVKGEPVTFGKVVKSDAAGFMAATLTPGMRAVSISVSLASVAGGFIQPGDRVDLVQTRAGGDASKGTSAAIVLEDVRVLAVDQATAAKDKDKAVSDAKTVTLELMPEQTKIVAQAQAVGVLSLALRPLGERDGQVKYSRDDSGPIVIVRGISGPKVGGRE
jgi:pilus assembly protein CpaB